MILRLRALNTFLEDEFWVIRLGFQDEGLEFPGEQWYHIIDGTEGKANGTTTGGSK